MRVIDERCLVYVSVEEKDSGRVTNEVRTEEFRKPKKGEWYLSGATPEAYRASNDLSSRYHILRLVVVENRPVIVDPLEIRNRYDEDYE